MNALARELRLICKHDSFTVAGCTTCAAADALEDAARMRVAAVGFSRRPSLWVMQAHEVLQLISTPMRPDGTWNRDREACRQLAAEALGRDGIGDEDVQP